MGELSDKQTCVHKYRVFSGAYGSPSKSEMEEEEKKTMHAFKNNFIDRKNFIRQYQRNG